MNNKAYEWLSEWVESGSWYLGSYPGVWNLGLNGARSGSLDDVGFRKDLRKLLDAAEKGLANE